MTGVESLIVERGGSIEFSGSAHTARLPNETKWHKDNPFNLFTAGLVNIPIVIVTNTGVVKIAKAPMRYILQLAETVVKKGKWHIKPPRVSALCRVFLFSFYSWCVRYVTVSLLRVLIIVMVCLIFS